MHIAFLTPEYPLPDKQPGGIGTYVKKTASELHKRGHQVSVFLESSKSGESIDHGVKIYEIKCPPLYYGLNSKSLINQLARVGIILYSAFQIKRKVYSVTKKNPINILQSTNYLAPGYFLRKNHMIPLVCRVSSYEPLYHAAYGQPRSLGDYLIDYLELRQVSDADAKFSPSKFMINVYERLESCKLDFIPTPFDIDQSGKFDNSLLENVFKKLVNKRYLLYFGSMSRIKGVDLMADVINKLAPEYPDLGFVFIGKDYGLPEGQTLSEFIQKKCARYRQRILFFPFQPHSLLYPVIKNSIAVVVPSRVDNYPNTCLEAQSLGIPVVGTNNSSLEELIEDGKTGFIAKNSSSASLTEKIELVLKMNKRDRLEMRRNIRKNILKGIKKDRIGLLLSYYEKINRS